MKITAIKVFILTYFECWEFLVTFSKCILKWKECIHLNSYQTNKIIVHAFNRLYHSNVILSNYVYLINLIMLECNDPCFMNNSVFLKCTRKSQCPSENSLNLDFWYGVWQINLKKKYECANTYTSQCYLHLKYLSLQGEIF